MLVLTASFMVSCATILLLVRYSHLHDRFTADSDMLGVQKFHPRIVPRVGGFGIFLGVASALFMLYLQNIELGTMGLMLIVASLPLFLSGFTEDITKKVGVKVRLLSATL